MENSFDGITKSIRKVTGIGGNDHLHLEQGYFRPNIHSIENIFLFGTNTILQTGAQQMHSQHE
jgi:hypothetical protein